MTKTIVLEVFREILGQLGRSAIRKIWNFALQVIEEINPMDLADSHKRDLAYERVKTGAKALGHDLSDNAINTIIEIAIAHQKQSQTSIPAPAAGPSPTGGLSPSQP